MSTSTDKFFTRQTAVPNWNTPEKQQRIKNQVALLLGTGGIGCSVALVLARLGIREIILTDMDTVEASNINRQLLFTENDVGARKVDAAKKNLDLEHAVRGRTRVTAIHCDLVEEWGSKILPLFSEKNSAPTVIFNACDWGESFDRFVAEFARSRNIPYCAAASYAHHADFELVKNEISSSSASCLSCRLGCGSLSTSLLHSMLQASSSNNNKNAHLCFLPQDKKPETGTVGSSVLPCSMAGQLVVNCWINRVVVVEEEEENNNSDCENRGNVFGMCELGSGVPEFFSFPTEKDPKCLFCGGGQSANNKNNSKQRRQQEQHNEETFSLAFGGEPVVLADAPKNSVSMQSPAESSEERKQRIHLYRQLAEKIKSEEQSNGKQDDVEAIVKKILPNLQGHFSVKDRSTFVPCTPTVPYLLEGDDSAAKSFYNDPSKNVFVNQLLSQPNNNITNISLLRNPLIKSKTGHVHGIRSGLRSAIIPPPSSKFIHDFVKNIHKKNNNNSNASPSETIYNRFSFNGNLLRLKGCGCVTHDTVENTKRKPFPVRDLDHPELKQFMPDAPDRWEIRGCQFLDTAIRESIVTKQIAEILSASPTPLMLGNYPACLWKYSDSCSKQELEVADPRYGSIDKFCGVFRTVGDKRAEMHLLNGLDLLVCLMLRSRTNEENEQMDTELKNRLFTESRKRSSTTKNQDGIEETTTTILPTWNRAKGEPLWCCENNSNDNNNNASTLIDDAASIKLASIPEFAAFENVLQQQKLNSTDNEDSSCTIAMLSKINSPYVNLWKELMEEFKNLPPRSSSTSTSSSSFFSHIYQRLGYEMGYFHGLLNGSGFSWGLFFDHHPCEAHNNAHPNNFVVVAGSLLSPSGSATADDAPTAPFFTPRQYLAAVDFDMSYSRDEFISNFTGELDDDLFRSNLEWERREMESVLSGNDDVSSGIVKGVVETRWKELSSSTENEKPLPHGFSTIKYVTRDLLVAAMKRGYEQGQHVALKDGENCKLEIPATLCNVNNERIMNIVVKLSLILTDRMNC